MSPTDQRAPASHPPIDTRLPLVCEAAVLFHAAKGAAACAPPVPARTRTIARNGLAVALTGVPGEILAAELQQHRETGRELRADVTLAAGGRSYCLPCKVAWLQMREGRPVLIGFEFAGVTPEVSEALVRHAERRYLGPRLIRIVAGVALAVLVLGGGSLLALQLRHDAQLAAIEAELRTAETNRQQAAERLAQVKSQYDALRASQAAHDSEVVAKQRELAAVRREYEALRTKAGELTAARIELRGEESHPQANREALSHLQRGNYFSAQNNLAAALVEYERAVAMDANLAEAYLEQALINDLYNRAPEALTAYRRYLELRPAAVDAYEIRENIRELEAELGSGGQVESE